MASTSVPLHYFEFRVHGRCRDEGRPGAFGAAAAYRSGRDDIYPGNRSHSRTRALTWLAPTDQQAEIVAVTVALEWALEDIIQPQRGPYGERNSLHVVVYSDSDYALKCLEEWVPVWERNGWLDARSGIPVPNENLLREAARLGSQVERLGGRLEYRWTSLYSNVEAHAACNRRLDQMDREIARSLYN
ncbi:hypothetical protein GGR56DRAFT_524492 [Xylariaceae sp. FL0804]|nr:hypothetical protein GGR56DRAFT_524492 [Xylariaceae sp. FL0804]